MSLLSDQGILVILDKLIEGSYYGAAAKIMSSKKQRDGMERVVESVDERSGRKLPTLVFSVQRQHVVIIRRSDGVRREVAADSMLPLMLASVVTDLTAQ